MLLASSRAVVNVLDAAEETSREVQKGEAEATSKQCLYFLKSVGIKNKKKREMMIVKLENSFLTFCILVIFQGKQKNISNT